MAISKKNQLIGLDIGSHSIRAFFDSFDIINATPSVCSWSSSSCPEYIISSPVASVVLPAPFHLTSLMPRTSMLYLAISLATCAAFPVSYIVLTFHCPILVICLVLRSKFGWLASRGVWPDGVILLTLEAAC